MISSLGTRTYFSIRVLGVLLLPHADFCLHPELNRSNKSVVGPEGGLSFEQRAGSDTLESFGSVNLSNTSFMTAALIFLSFRSAG
jgi:hypothetical protein